MQQMNKMTYLKALALIALLGCGTDNAVNVECPEAGCAPVTVKAEPVPTVSPETPTTTPVAAKPAVVPEVAKADPKDCTLTFSFQVSHREAWATDFCDEMVDSVLEEGEDIQSWTCRDEPITAYHEPWVNFQARNWTVEEVKRMVSKTVFDDLKSSSDCKVSGAKSMKCTLVDNFVTVQAVAVNDLDGKHLYQNVVWKVYYWPKLDF